MPAHRRFVLSLATYSAIYGCSESLLKRASASGVDVSSRKEVLNYVRAHARETTRFGTPEKPITTPRPIAPSPAPAPIKPKAHVAWSQEAVDIFNSLSTSDQHLATKCGCTLTDPRSFDKFLAAQKGK